MHLIKLNAIDSTNDYLKVTDAAQNLPNFTVVTAEIQTSGRGQMGAKWVTEPGKNLIMSVIVKNVLADVTKLFTLNVAVALAVYQGLKKNKIPKLSIKWPNDIMSDTKKLGGILIENSIKADGTIVSIVGIGLNVNQTNFEGLPKASSLSAVTGLVFDKESVLADIMDALEHTIGLMHSGKKEQLWDNYIKSLFRLRAPMPFEYPTGSRFMGMIQGVSAEGKLQVLLEDDSIAEFGIKELQMLY